ncbi:MAG: transglutaminase family protein [Pseudomonadota bacterium]
MRYSVIHNTFFDYEMPVVSAHQVLRLKPRDVINRQQVLKHRLVLSMQGADNTELLDYFGNHLLEVRLYAQHQGFSIRSESEIDIAPRDNILLDLSPPWEQVAAEMRDPESIEAWEAVQFAFASPLVDVDAARAYAQEFAAPEIPLLRLALNLTETIYRDFSYQGGVTDIHTQVGDVIAEKRGVCQDFAHVALAVLRALGLAARYVSGYILSQPAGQPALQGAEASHAWISVYCPEFGWIDFDPTNNQMTGDQHITLGWGRDYGDVAPTRGAILGGGRQKVDVEVAVRPI